MIHSIFNIKDTTLYERYPVLNTGLDSVLEIGQTIDETSSYSSRALIKFDLTQLSATYASNLLTQTASYYLKLTTTEPTEIPLAYTIYAYPISQSWNMGTGRYVTTATTSNGASWRNRLTSTSTGSAWITGSFATGTTGSWSTNPGGGVWFTASVHSQSFDYESADIFMDVTTTVRQWLAGTKTNEGFLLKLSSAQERDTTNPAGVLRFYSKDSNTIYGPRLEMRYSDVIYHTSYSIVDYSDEVVVNITNLQNQYAEDSTVRINISARPKYPTRTHATSSNYLDQYQLKSSSLYSVRDAHTDNVIIPFDDANTAISADTRGSYFLLNLNSLVPERYYRILLKSKVSSTEEYIYDKNWIFKVVS